MELLWLLATGGVSLFGYWKTRQFVRRRLRFVDAVERPGAPLVAGTVAALAAAPIAWLLPVIGITTAVVFGAGVGIGVHHGAKDVKRLPGI
ncbi:MAG: hypothetical protein ACE5PT_06250 [Gemmatimonadales bacterium]